jgi:hypothetical protein
MISSQPSMRAILAKAEKDKVLELTKPKKKAEIIY